jgi:formimidoylglutamase
VPHTSPPKWPAVAATRFASTIRTDEHEKCTVALLGLPDDLGVRLNGGRPGAREGPDAFRAALAGYGTAWDARRGAGLHGLVYDAGDVIPAHGDGEAALMETHARVEAAVLQLHGAGLIVACIGGGHDLTLPAVAALAQHSGLAVGGINFDAHTDVRERIGSGMPFRKLIEKSWLSPTAFVEVGLSRFVNSEADWEWLVEQGSVAWRADDVLGLRRYRREVLPAAMKIALRTESAAFVSIDLDGIDSAQAPGVSAMNPCGLSVRHAALLAEAAGREQRIWHFDIMELSPPHDVTGRTARVAAHLFLSFVAGVVERA